MTQTRYFARTRGARRDHWRAGGSFIVADAAGDSLGCYLQDVDLGDTTNALLPSSAFAAADIPSLGLRDNFGSDQISAITLGTPIDVELDTTLPKITVGASNVRVTTGGTLSRIEGGAAGDLLVISAAGSLSVTEGDNIRLPGATGVTLADPKDRLTLVYDGSNWLQVSFSQNV